MKKYIFCDLQTEENDYEFVCHKCATQDMDRESEDVCLSCRHHCDKVIDIYTSNNNEISTEMK